MFLLEQPQNVYTHQEGFQFVEITSVFLFVTYFLELLFISQG